MGTSQSSAGPGPSVPMVPPWVPDPPAIAPTPSPEGPSDGAQDDSSAPHVSPPVLVAPPGRFGGVRRSLGEYARSGDGQAMRRGLGHYVRKGYGGAKTAVRRFGGTAATADALYSALSVLSGVQAAAPGDRLDRNLLAGRTADEVMDAVVEAIRPIDGTQDAEAQRCAIRDALSDLLTRFPDADLLNLDANERSFVIECFAAIDVFRRFELDVGKTVQEKAPNASSALARLKEVQAYVKETVSASFRKLRDAGRALTAGRVSEVVRDALQETFEVFEEYAT